MLDLFLIKTTKDRLASLSHENMIAQPRIRQVESKDAALLFSTKLDFLTKQIGITRILLQERNNRRGVFNARRNHFVSDVSHAQRLAVIRQFPREVSVLPTIGIEILHTRKRCLCDIGMVSAEQVTVVINDVDAIIQFSEFQFFFAIIRGPVAK